MKKSIFLSMALALLANMSTHLSAQVKDANGYTTVEATMGQNYQNRVFYSFGKNNLISQPAETWDIAFYRNSMFETGTRINDAKNILVYVASEDPTQWDSVNTSIVSTGTPLYNPDKTEKIEVGAFEQGPRSLGWGDYNPTTHQIEGKVIYILHYGGAVYYKFMIENRFKNYKIKYAKLKSDGTWDETKTAVIPDGTDDAFFNYFSLETNAQVPNLEPAKKDWDIMFTRYWTFYNNVAMYRMSGIIQNPNIVVAQTNETQDTPTFTAPVASKYSKGITTIGHSWKGISTVHNNVVYYIKNNSTKKFYRMYFIINGGASTGNMHFKYKDITDDLGVQDLNTKASFGVYPNPTVDKRATLLFDVKEKDSNKGTAELYDLSGKKVYEVSLSNQNGLYKEELNFQHLPAGNYILKVSYGGASQTKKLILK